VLLLRTLLLEQPLQQARFFHDVARDPVARVGVLGELDRRVVLLESLDKGARAIDRDLIVFGAVQNPERRLGERRGALDVAEAADGDDRGEAVRLARRPVERPAAAHRHAGQVYTRGIDLVVLERFAEERHGALELITRVGQADLPLRRFRAALVFPVRPIARQAGRVFAGAALRDEDKARVFALHRVGAQPFGELFVLRFDMIVPLRASAVQVDDQRPFFGQSFRWHEEQRRMIRRRRGRIRGNRERRFAEEVVGAERGGEEEQQEKTAHG
jgi:hypothetical protein